MECVYVCVYLQSYMSMCMCVVWCVVRGQASLHPRTHPAPPLNMSMPRKQCQLNAVLKGLCDEPPAISAP